MEEFANLVLLLGASTKTNDKLEALQHYFTTADDKDKVWCTDWNANAMLRFDPLTEIFETIPMPRPGALIRQILGRAGEVWLPESGTEHISVIKTG